MKKDWEIKKLGEVCDLQNGFAFKSSDYVEKSNVMNFRMSQIRPDGTMDLYHNTKYLPEDYANKYSDYLLSDGDVVIAMTDMASDPRILGRPTIVFTDGYKVLLNQRVGKLFKFDKNIYPKFLNYMLVSPSICDYYKSLGRGGLQLNISKQDILNASIPVPPLEEQKRIVKILDEKFAHLETIKANAQTNLQNAKDLFQSQLAKAFSNTTWEKKRLGDICRITSGGTPSRTNKSYWENGNIPWVKTTELQNNELNSTEEFITQKGLDESSAKIVPKDTILLAMYGQGKTRGMTAYLNIEATTNQACACILPSEDKNIYPKYIWKFLIGNYENIRNLAIGCNQPNLNSAMVKSIEIPLPPLPEQKRIVEELDTLSEKVRQLQEIYTKQIANCDELKQSLLQKAFEGEL